MSKASGFRPQILSFIILFVVSFATYSQEIPTDESVISSGEALFKANCTQCHQVHKKIIGPALKDVTDRLETSYLIDWVRNSQKVIQSGDEYAVALYEEYNQVAMPAYPFSDDQILSLLAYVKAESANEPEQAAQATASADGGTTTTAEDAIPSGYLTAVLVVLVVVLVLILIVLGLIVSVLKRYLKEKKDIDEADREIIEQKFDLLKLLKSDAIAGFVIFLFTAILLKTLIDGAFTIGVQQGYQPTQPIAFSHELHAGQYEIDCNYCHTGVRKAKSANIPSPNICMNCHSAIQNVGGESGVSTEIAKIYAAVDYDPNTGLYGPNKQPIEWVRIHNLPDLAYFNHSQHVEVGGLECETCHGPVQEMDVVYQYAPLTMGWCINCHRETEVNAKDNEYYSKLIELHEEHSKEPMVVEDIGGLECSKCHY